DHSIAYPLVRACDDCANLGIIQLDAHLDFADDVQGVSISSSSPLRRISELPFVGPMAAIGLRGLRTDPAAFMAARDRGNALISRAALREAGPAAVVAGLPAMQQIYLTLDIDVLDPTLAPGARGRPCPLHSRPGTSSLGSLIRCIRMPNAWRACLRAHHSWQRTIDLSI